MELTLTLEGGELSVSLSGRIIPDGSARRPHWIGDWVYPRAGLDVLEKRNISCHCWASNSDLSRP